MELPLSLLLGAGTLAAILWGRGRRPSNAAGASQSPAAEPSVPFGTPAATSGGAAATSSGGAGVVAAKSGRAPFELLKGRWVWPVPITRGRRPDISSGWGSPRGDRQHEGVDIMFRRLATDPFPVGSPNGSKLFVMPDETLVVAACDGYLWFAGKTARGWSVQVDHSDAIQQKVVSYYTHMEKLFVELTSRGRGRIRVYAGQPLGIIGGDPLDGRHLKHLHFALWAGNAGDAFDAAPFMRTWEMIRDPRESGPSNPPAATTGSIPPSGAAGGTGSALLRSQDVPVCRVGDTTTVGPGGFPVCTPAPSPAEPSASPIPAALTLAPSPAFPQSRLVSSPAQRRQARAAAARAAALTCRNAGLVFRPVGSSGEPYPKWLRGLRGQSGVYFIRERSADGNESELVYIGQSQAGRLYETLTRHFQTWRRAKGFWRGYSENDPGMTYARERVEVAVRITTPSRALEEEARFIRAMRPRDNVLGLHDDADVPF
jgi:murein DD-endopeptidase MepM/ murein hydrolase activator NlpD